MTPIKGKILAYAVFFSYGLFAVRTSAAHGFGQRYDLPLPLDLYLWGAAATVALSFVLAGLFLRVSGERTLRVDLLQFRLGRLIAHPLLVESLRVVSVSLFVLIIVAGLIGVQNPFKNIAPTLVWILWWVGMAYVSALFGDLWALINPWAALFRWAEIAWKHSCGSDLSRHRPWPAAWGVWPAVSLFFTFAWLELVWPYSDHPSSLAYMILLYSLLTWMGMLLYGRETWLCHGEVFSLVFALFARFAPLAGDHTGEKWVLRPYAVGLLITRPVSVSLTALVVLLLATVTFDGFSETPGWVAVMEWTVALPGVGDALFKLGDAGVPADMVLTTAALLIFPCLFFLVFLLFSGMIGVAVRTLIPIEKRPAAVPSLLHLAGWFVLTLVPISIAYHLAHYLSYLAIAGQYVIPIASDPFGFGWDLFGTKLYLINIGIVTARFVWYTSLIAIIVGHVIAIYLAHRTALRIFPNTRVAVISQLPMLVLMIGYTMISLWIIAQPIIQS